MRWWRADFASRAMTCWARATQTSRACSSISTSRNVLRDLIASLGTRPIFVGGIGFGGAIALRYAIEHPG
jgi:pimeloyl-ACP methyl ester carboxylesterase